LPNIFAILSSNSFVLSPKAVLPLRTLTTAAISSSPASPLTAATLPPAWLRVEVRDYGMGVDTTGGAGAAWTGNPAPGPVLAAASPAAFTICGAGLVCGVEKTAAVETASYVPITVAAIFFLLFLLFKSVKFATLIITVLPFASVGGVIGLFISGEYLSVPASVGFIALWGIAVLNGVVLVSYIRSLREGGMSVQNAVLEGARQRFRPVMMTATVAMLGLIPFLISDGPGSEVQRPLAIVVIGGLITCTLLTLVVVPTIYHWFDESEPEA
jgi:hypothetical protein